MYAFTIERSDTAVDCDPVNRAVARPGATTVAWCAALATMGMLLASVPFAVAAVALAPAVVAARVDRRDGRLPDRLVVMTLAPSIGMLIAISDRSIALAMLAGASMFAGPLFLLHLASPSAMGFGDVKFAVALGATLGAIDPRIVVFALFIASAGCVLGALTLRRSDIVFGPGLVAGSTLALMGAAVW